MRNAQTKLLDLTSAGRRSLGVGMIIVLLFAVASILVDVWLIEHLQAHLRTHANDGVALSTFVERRLAQTGGWVLRAKAAVLLCAVVIAVAFARSLGEQIGQLAESRERNRAIVDNMVDGAIHIDGNGQLVALNAAAERMFGQSSKEARGDPLSILLAPAHRQQIETKIRLAAARVGTEPPLNVAFEVQGLRGNGTRFPLYLAISEVMKGSYPLFTAIARDLTETKRQM